MGVCGFAIGGIVGNRGVRWVCGGFVASEA